MIICLLKDQILNIRHNLASEWGEKWMDKIEGKLKEKLSENKDLAYLSRTLGTIDINAPIEKDLGAFQVEEWNKPEVLEIFKKLKFL